MHQHYCHECDANWFCPGEPNCGFEVVDIHGTKAGGPKPYWPCPAHFMSEDVGDPMTRPVVLECFTAELSFGGVTKEEVQRMLSGVGQMVKVLGGTFSVEKLQKAED